MKNIKNSVALCSLVINYLMIILVLLSCKSKDNTPSSPPMPGKPLQSIGATLEATSFSLKLIKLENGVASMEIVNLDSEANLECFHNEVVIPECKRKFQVELYPGKNVFEVYKKQESKVVGYSDLIVQHSFDSSNFATMADSIRSKDPLFLVPNQVGFKDGFSQDRSKDFVFEFKLARANSCKPVFKCSYDQREPNIWRVCSDANKHVIPSELIAKGIQYLHVRAECGTSIGPTLSIHFYGVQKDYQWLSLDRFRIASTNEDIFLLEKSNDCPESLLKFECMLDSNTTVFSSCKNRQSKISSSFKIRGLCDSKPGPVHVVL